MSGQRRGADVGSGFQIAINSTNTAYAQAGRAYITRKSIPGKYLMRRDRSRKGLAIPDLDIASTSVSSDTLRQLASQQGRALTREFVPESKAEPDYGGAIAPEGRAIVYDAKSTQRDRLDVDNLHPHQIHFLEQMASTGAISGFLVEFAKYRKIFFLPIQLTLRFTQTTGYKSVPYSFFDRNLTPVSAGKGLLIFDYLTAIADQESRYGRDYSLLDLSTEKRKG